MVIVCLAVGAICIFAVSFYIKRHQRHQQRHHDERNDNFESENDTTQQESQVESQNMLREETNIQDRNPKEPIINAFEMVPYGNKLT